MRFHELGMCTEIEILQYFLACGAFYFTRWMCFSFTLWSIAQWRHKSCFIVRRWTKLRRGQQKDASSMSTGMYRFIGLCVRAVIPVNYPLAHAIQHLLWTQLQLLRAKRAAEPISVSRVYETRFCQRRCLIVTHRLCWIPLESSSNSKLKSRKKVRYCLQKKRLFLHLWDWRWTFKNQE